MTLSNISIKTCQSRYCQSYRFNFNKKKRNTKQANVYDKKYRSNEFVNFKKENENIKRLMEKGARQKETK